MFRNCLNGKCQIISLDGDGWLNDNYIGSHEDGEAPFVFDVTDTVKVSKLNRMAVRVEYACMKLIIVTSKSWKDSGFGCMWKGKMSSLSVPIYVQILKTSCDFRIYNRALAAQKIKQHYKVQRP